MFLGLGAVLFIGAVDHRELLGLNVWVKPAKFLFSVGIYLWTLAWFMPYVTGPRFLKRLISWGVALALVAENALIVMQAARGVRSHFNFDTPFDAGVFSLMGTFIGINTLFLALFAVLLFLRPVEGLPRHYLWAVRLGALLLLAGSAEGLVMIERGAHAVGVPDGGPGLRFLNFSIEGGDLRAAHLMGLHGFQLIPLFGWGLWRRAPALDPRRKTMLVFGFAVLYTLVAAFLFWQAMSGRPILRPFG